MRADVAARRPARQRGDDKGGRGGAAGALGPPGRRGYTRPLGGRGRTGLDQVDCVVVGAGVVGLAVARALALAGREVIVLEGGGGHRHRNLLAQQRGDPRRHLLPRRQPDGALLRRRPARAVRLLPRARRAAPQLRQADRRDLRRGGRQAGRHQGAAPKRTASRGCGCCPRPRRARWSRRWPAPPRCSRRPPASSTATPTCWPCKARPRHAGALIVFLQPGGRRARRARSGIEIEVGGAEPMTLRCRLLVNSAGLHAPALARRIAGMPAERVPDGVLCQGQLFHPEPDARRSRG